MELDPQAALFTWLSGTILLVTFVVTNAGLNGQRNRAGLGYVLSEIIAIDSGHFLFRYPMIMFNPVQNGVVRLVRHLDVREVIPVAIGLVVLENRVVNDRSSPIIVDDCGDPPQLLVPCSKLDSYSPLQ